MTLTPEQAIRMAQSNWWSGMAPRDVAMFRLGCPRDSAGHAYPEFCKDTNRYDHQLTAMQLAESFEHYRRTGP